jgi:GNAT superfamily N-acetyltransferase
MSRPVRLMTEADLPTATSLWNEWMVHDRLTEEELRRALFGGRQPQDSLIAEADGWVAAVASEDTGHITAVCGSSSAVVADLIRAAEARLAAGGVRRLVASEYGGCPLAPGIDLRYDTVKEGFRRAGYGHTHTLDDMELPLIGYAPTPYQQAARRTAEAYGVEVVDWRPGLAAPLRAFADRAVPGLPADWFWESWEHGPDMVVALMDAEVVGYANYSPDLKQSFGRYHRPNSGAFGPIGVLTAHRGHGIGTWLLVEATLRVGRAGRDWLWAGWTNTPFYIPNGWHVCRQFAVWERGLGDT